MRIWVLGSGSRGNATLVEDGDARVLVDAGFAAPDLVRRLRETGVAPESIAAVLVTHAHGDHVRGVAAGCRRFGWVPYASAGTVAEAAGLAGLAVRPLVDGVAVDVAGFRVAPVLVPHDARETLMVSLTAPSGARAGVCTDLGWLPPGVAATMRDLDVLVLEANHDPDLLRVGPYPPSVQARIGGRTGHLSNAQAAEAAAALVHPRMTHLVLAHLSEQCNRPALARRTVGEALVPTAFNGRLHVATQAAVLGPLTPALRLPGGGVWLPRRRARAHPAPTVQPAQLDLLVGTE